MKEFDIVIHSEAHLTAVVERAKELGFNTKFYSREVVVERGGAAFYLGGNVTHGLFDRTGDRKTLDDLYNMSPTASLEIGSLSDKLVYIDGKVVVGCQTITLSDARKIADWINTLDKE